MPATHQHERSRRHDPSTQGPQPDVARTAWNTRRRVTLAVTTAAAVAVAGAGSLLLAAGTGQGSTPAPRRHATTAVSACAPAPAPCGSDNLDEVVIHAAYEAARRALEQQATPNSGATTPAP